MAAVWKVIKPARLKEDAMRLALLNGMRRIGRLMKKDFEKTVATWKNKPKFEILISLAGVGPTVVVDTNSVIYAYVTKGTDEHIILPRRAKALRFAGTFTAKTVPGVIDSRAGGSSGPDVFSRGVVHPGTEARNFDKLIAKKWQGPFRDEMHRIMKEVREASGHAL